MPKGIYKRKKGYKLLNDPEMQVTHLGQTDNIEDFFKKEMWRGNSLIKSTRQHGIIKEELPSTLITFYHLISITLFILSIIILNAFLINLYLFLLFLPSLLLTIKKTAETKRIDYFFKFYTLVFIYQIARAASLFRYNQFKDLF